MAEEKKPARKSRGEELYDSKPMKAARDAKGGGKSESKGAEPTRTEHKPLDAGEMLGRHAKEREAMRAGHEAGRRDAHNSRRDEHRAMNSRHEAEHKGASDHGSMVAMHRRHEHEKHRMRADHEASMGDMHRRHHEERHDMHQRHEQEVLAASGAMPSAGAAAAAAPAPGAVPPQAA